jgi:ElaB/YqjD/DUF883 family membrane-anchored ribosome-binding protein
MRTISRAPSSRAERARRRAHVAIDELSDRVVPLIDRVAKRGHAIVERTAIGASDAADALVYGKSRFAVASDAVLRRGRDSIRENPLLSIGIGAVAGALVYGYWRSRRG